MPDDTITEHNVKIFCKHVSELCVIRGTRIADEYECKGSVDNELCKFIVILIFVLLLLIVIIYVYKCILRLVQSLEDPDSLIEHYIILRGIERFYSEYYTYPGEIDEQVEPDIPKLKVLIF